MTTQTKPKNTMNYNCKRK